MGVTNGNALFYFPDWIELASLVHRWGRQFQKSFSLRESSFFYACSWKQASFAANEVGLD
jgi:hypothetical protein